MFLLLEHEIKNFEHKEKTMDNLDNLGIKKDDSLKKIIAMVVAIALIIVSVPFCGWLSSLLLS